MKSNSTLTIIAPKTAQVIAACREAFSAGQDYALKALIAGQLLVEHREAMRSSCHDGKNLPWQGTLKPDTDKFSIWLEQNGVPSRTAYRWMDAAERLGRAALGTLGWKVFSTTIEIAGAEPMSLSQALTLPEDKVSGAALTYRQGIFEFMADHTLGEAARAVFDDQSRGIRITLAASGKLKGGKGEADRKDFPLFIAKNLMAMSGNLKGWEKWRKKEPAQHSAVVATLRQFVVTGGRVATHAVGGGKVIEPWPLSFCELLGDLVKERLRKERS